MGIEGLEHEELLKLYRDLQLRVTRFSATEQALINTRDRLDQELELYKRMQRYNAMLLNVPSLDRFFALVCEGIVDVFELECAISARKIHDSEKWELFAEGHKIESGMCWDDDLNTLCQLHRHGESHILKLDDFSFLKCLSPFFEGLYFHLKDVKSGNQILFLGLNSKANSALYRNVQERHLALFNVFMQNVQSIFSNHQRSAEIEEQLGVIQKSSAELRKLSLIATKTKNGVIITDAHGHVEWVNEAFTKISGYNLEEVKGRKPKDFLQGKQTDEVSRKKLSDALWSKDDIEMTVVNYDKSGNPYYNQLEIISVFDEHGNHVNFIALQKDITHEIQSQQEMLKLNSRFKIITNHSKIGLWEWTAEDDKVEWSEELYLLHGISPSSSKDIRESWLNAMAENDRARILGNVESLRNGEKQVVKDLYKIVRQDNFQVRMIETLAISEKNDQGEVVRMVGSSKDVTEELSLIHQRDESLAQIQLLKSFYENILQNSPMDIVVIGTDGKIVFKNNRRENHTLWSRLPQGNDLLSGDVNEQGSLNDLVISIRRSIKERRMVQWEDVSADGDWVYLYNVLPHFEENGNWESIIVTGVDISELKKIQNSMSLTNDELRKINLELDNFVYSISHDLRSPLLSIKGIISLVLHDQGLPEKAVQFLNMADQSVARLDGTIQEILEYSRNSRLDIQPEWMDLSELVQNIFDDLKFITEDPLEMVMAFKSTSLLFNDKARISVLLKNIIGNSVKYRKAGQQSVVKFSFDFNDTHAVMQIEDNGQGIDENHIGRVFEMFFRGTSASIGTGLGLYICKEIVSKLGGEIQVKSQKGLGTTMTISLPLIQNEI